MELRETISLDRLKYYKEFDTDKYQIIGYTEVNGENQEKADNEKQLAEEIKNN